MKRFLCLLALVGCGDIIGLNGYVDQDGAPIGEGGADASNDVVQQQDTSKPDVTAMDVATDTSDGCVPMAEDCTNGKDDDCNGLADCLDPACVNGFICVPPLPMGWSWTAYDPDQRQNCATGYSMPTDVQEGITAAAATCGCSCTTTQPTCNTGNVTITAGQGGQCSQVTNQSQTATAGCHALTQFATNNQSIKVTGPAPVGGSCAANPTKNVPMLSYQHSGRTCAYGGAGGIGCGMNVCIPKAAPAVACVQMNGNNMCPTGYPVQHFIGTMVNDTRSCTACTCNFSAGTCGGTTTFYTDNNCQNNAEAVVTDNACHGVSNRTWRTYQYAPTTNGSCTASMSSANGSATFSDLKTVCCTM